MILSQENILLSTNLFGQEVRQRLVEDYASSAFRAELFQNIIRDNWFGIDCSGYCFWSCCWWWFWSTAAAIAATTVLLRSRHGHYPLCHAALKAGYPGFRLISGPGCHGMDSPLGSWFWRFVVCVTVAFPWLIAPCDSCTSARFCAW